MKSQMKEFRQSLLPNGEAQNRRAEMKPRVRRRRGSVIGYMQGFAAFLSLLIRITIYGFLLYITIRISLYLASLF